MKRYSPTIIALLLAGVILVLAGGGGLLLGGRLVWAAAAGGVGALALATAALLLLRRVAALEDSDSAARIESLEAALDAEKSSNDRLEGVIATLPDAVFFVAPDGIILEVNQAAARLLARSPEQLVGMDMHSLLTANDRRENSRQEEGQPREAVLCRSDGMPVSVAYTQSPVVDETGKVQSHVYTLQNIDDRKRTEKRIRYLARTDPLTRMVNRMQFQHLLQQSIQRARRDHAYLAILYLDVDRFRDINDTFGHSAGDASLEIFSQRIIDALPEDAIAGRLSGDEFCILLDREQQLDAMVEIIHTIGNKVLHSVGRPFRVHGEEIFMSTSVGAAIYPRDGENVVDLLRNADAALHQAKRAGGNCIEFFSQQIASVGEERLMLKSKLRRAFERDELRLDFQPKYRISDGRLAGVEALIRWDLPERGIVLPSDFIPIAEESNLIQQVGEWVLNRVCADFRDWQRLMPSPARVSINLSLRQLLQQRFLDGVRKTFREHGVSPTCFEFEITETTLMQDTKRTVKILDALYGMGVHLAIDDFGTGYSSLSALQQFPISTLKIDQSFVRDITIDKDNAAIVRTVIQMARSLKLDVVAEGVENQEQLDFLRSNGCDIVQGHLFGDPMSADEFRDLMLADAEGSGRYRALFA